MDTRETTVIENPTYESTISLKDELKVELEKELAERTSQRPVNKLPEIPLLSTTENRRINMLPAKQAHHFLYLITVWILVVAAVFVYFNYKSARSEARIEEAKDIILYKHALDVEREKMLLNSTYAIHWDNLTDIQKKYLLEVQKLVELKDHHNRHRRSIKDRPLPCNVTVGAVETDCLVQSFTVECERSVSAICDADVQSLKDGRETHKICASSCKLIGKGGASGYITQMRGYKPSYFTIPIIVKKDDCYTRNVKTEMGLDCTTDFLNDNDKAMGCKGFYKRVDGVSYVSWEGGTFPLGFKGKEFRINRGFFRLIALANGYKPLPVNKTMAGISEKYSKTQELKGKCNPNIGSTVQQTTTEAPTTNPTTTQAPSVNVTVAPANASSNATTTPSTSKKRRKRAASWSQAMDNARSVFLVNGKAPTMDYCKKTWYTPISKRTYCYGGTNNNCRSWVETELHAVGMIAKGILTLNLAMRSWKGFFGCPGTPEDYGWFNTDEEGAALFAMQYAKLKSEVVTARALELSEAEQAQLVKELKAINSRFGLLEQALSDVVLAAKLLTAQVKKNDKILQAQIDLIDGAVVLTKKSVLAIASEQNKMREVLNELVDGTTENRQKIILQELKIKALELRMNAVDLDLNVVMGILHVARHPVEIGNHTLGLKHENLNKMYTYLKSKLSGNANLTKLLHNLTKEETARIRVSFNGNISNLLDHAGRQVNMSRQQGKEWKIRYDGFEKGLRDSENKTKDYAKSLDEQQKKREESNGRLSDEFGGGGASGKAVRIGAAIAGTVGGGGVGIVLIIILICCCKESRKRASSKD